MQLTANRSTSTGTLDLPTHSMQIDPAALGKLMDMLSSIYSDGFGSVLREYLANAIDSHRTSGNPDPVELELPNAFEPNLIVRDHGTGLSHDDLLNVYAFYGRSTKDSDDDAIGAFGIGAKSAFAIASTFTVDAVKDGERTVAIFSSTSEDGVPTVRVVSRAPTEDPNGVTVKVPIGSDVSDTPLDDAQRILRTWEPGSVLLNGERPVSVFDDALDLGGGLYLPPKEQSFTFPKLTIVMGGIGYTIRNHELYRITDGRNTSWPDQEVVAVVPIGAVDLSPDREGVRDTLRTKVEVNRLHSLFRDKAPTALRAIINDAPTVFDAMRTWIGLESKLRKMVTDDNGRVPWNGRPIDPMINLSSIPGESFRHCKITYNWSEAKTSNRHTGSLSITGAGLSGLTIVHGCTSLHKARMSAKRYAQALVNNGNERINELVFVESDSGSHEWLSWGAGSTDFTNVSYDDYLAKAATVKTANGGRTGSRSAGPSYRTYVHDLIDPEWTNVLRSNLGKYDVILYAESTTPKPYTSKISCDALVRKYESSDQSFALVQLSGVNTAKALKDNIDQTPVPVMSVIDSLAKSGDLVEDDTLRSMAMAMVEIPVRVTVLAEHVSRRPGVAKLFDDDDIAILERARSINRMNWQARGALRRDARLIPGGVDLDDIKAEFTDGFSRLDFPLMASEPYGEPQNFYEHLILYLTTVIASDKQKGTT